VLGALIAMMASPALANAHGPVAPVATSYLAKVTGLPRGLEAKVIDGDQRMWLRVPPSRTVVVLDYRGAPYLRFSGSGVAVNRNSATYYLNQTPSEVPPSSLTRSTPARWQRVTGAHAYGWHDGRLHALAGVAVLPGVTLAGRWSIPLLVGGDLRSISGGLWRAPSPSLVWFWPIVVLLACVMAARRLHATALDTGVARTLALAALIAIAVGGCGRQLHARPAVSAWQLILLGTFVVFVGWGLRRLLVRRHGSLFFFVVSIAALWEGLELLPTLLHGFVLMAVPASVARVAAVLCLGAGAGLLVLAPRFARQGEDDVPAAEAQVLC
jgi:hypothetical protein